MKKEIIENTFKGSAKGGIYENLIADILIKKDRKLNYYKADNNSQEIEFLLPKDGSVVPIEIKSSNNPSISLNNFLLNPDIKIGYKLISGNIGQVEKKISLPLYMAMFF
jgi:hypothetical protein